MPTVELACKQMGGLVSDLCPANVHCDYCDDQRKKRSQPKYTFKQVKEAQLATARFRKAIAPFIETNQADLLRWFEHLEARLRTLAAEKATQ